jgi:hypothetical protein
MLLTLKTEKAKPSNIDQWTPIKLMENRRVVQTWNPFAKQESIFKWDALGYIFLGTISGVRKPLVQ